MTGEKSDAGGGGAKALQGREMVIGVTGGIAAYKTAFLNPAPAFRSR